MKKIRKGKKMLIIFLAVFLVLVAVVLIVNIVNKEPENPEVPEDIQQIIPLPDTTYSGMEVKNVVMEYLKDNNETIVTMEIHNTTTTKVENEKLEVIWIGPDENILGQIDSDILNLEVGEMCVMNVILDGDLTSTTQIKLVKK